ncbi:MAG: hypothetical protein ACI4TX_01845, partial [Christensenellales bacterium]
MELSKDSATILRLDEIRELILNLSKTGDSKSFEEIATTITNQIATILEDLKASIVNLNNEEISQNSMEERVVAKIIEIYDSISSTLTNVISSLISVDVKLDLVATQSAL